jgi:hypothetical protein
MAMLPGWPFAPSKTLRRLDSLNNDSFNIDSLKTSFLISIQPMWG